MDGHIFELCCFALLLLTTGNIWFIYRVVRPLRRLSIQAASITRGDFDALQEPCGGISEIETLRRSMAFMVGHVRRAQAQSRSYADMLASGQETERTRIARELHDDTVQSLVAISQSIEIAHNWLETAPQRASALLKSARQQAVEAVDGLRQLIADLRPPALEELGLIAALQMQASKMNDLHTQIEVEGVEHRLDEMRELALFRCAQEALNNARCHGQATSVEIKVQYSCDGVSLLVSDNGTGFSPPACLDDLVARGHYGLMGIQERVQHLNGRVQMTSSPHDGLSLAIYIPHDCTHQPDHTVRDPVCSAIIEPRQAYSSVLVEGERYYFCCPVCEGAFQRNPAMYLQPETPLLQRIEEPAI